MEQSKNNSLFWNRFQILYQILIVLYAPIFVLTKLADFAKGREPYWLMTMDISIIIFTVLFGFLAFVRYYVIFRGIYWKWLNDAVESIFSTKLILLYIIMLIYSSFQINRIFFQDLTAKPIEWVLATMWEEDLPILGQNMDKMAEEIYEKSGKKLKITVLHGGVNKDNTGKILYSYKVQNLLTALKKNEIQMLHSASYYSMKSIKEAFFFSAVPFGMDKDEMSTWIDRDDGEGYKLWLELYEPHGLIPFECGHTGQQMGGWFKKEIKSIDDFKGLRMRIAGLGEEVLKQHHVIPKNFFQSEISKAMLAGDLDAVEWIGPYHDQFLRLNLTAQYYYEPGWQEPDTMFELVLNKKAFNELPLHLQTLIENVVSKYNNKISKEFSVKNDIARKQLVEGRVVFKTFPQPVIETLRKTSTNVAKKYIGDSRIGARIYDSYSRHNNRVKFQSVPQLQDPDPIQFDDTKNKKRKEGKK